MYLVYSVKCNKKNEFEFALAAFFRFVIKTDEERTQLYVGFLVLDVLERRVSKMRVREA